MSAADIDLWQSYAILVLAVGLVLAGLRIIAGCDCPRGHDTRRNPTTITVDNILPPKITLPRTLTETARRKRH